MLLPPPRALVCLAMGTLLGVAACSSTAVSYRPPWDEETLPGTALTPEESASLRTASREGPDQLVAVAMQVSAENPEAAPAVAAEASRLRPESAGLIAVTMTDLFPDREDEILAGVASAMPSMETEIPRSRSTGHTFFDRW